MPHETAVALNIAAWSVALILWGSIFVSSRRARSRERTQERGRDGGLTPRALEKLIHEQTRLGSKGDRSTSVGLVWNEHLNDHGRLLELGMALNTERIRVSALTQELKTTQDALADTVRRLEAIEASQRGSRLRSLLRP
jgi:hypothetical protein